MKYMNILQFWQFFKHITIGLLAALFLVFLQACSWNTPNDRSNTGKTAAVAHPIPPAYTSINSSVTNPLVSTKRQQVIQSALNQIGKPYRYGGNNPNGFDCSGLVQYSFADAGIAVPRSTQEQLKFFTEIPRKQLQAGDLVFFRIDNSQRHVAIMLNRTDFVHAPSSGKSVGTSNLSNPYWKAKFHKAARYY